MRVSIGLAILLLVAVQPAPALAQDCPLIRCENVSAFHTMYHDVIIPEHLCTPHGICHANRSTPGTCATNHDPCGSLFASTTLEAAAEAIEAGSRERLEHALRETSASIVFNSHRGLVQVISECVPGRETVVLQVRVPPTIVAMLQIPQRLALAK